MRSLALFLSIVLALTRGGTAQGAASDSEPSKTHAQIGASLGYLRTPCNDPHYDVPCATGVRSELSLNLLFKQRGEMTEAFSGRSGANFGRAVGEIPGNALSGARSPGELIAGILIMFLLIAILFGIFWALMGIGSQKLKLGLYTAQETFPKQWQVDGLEDYSAQATGFQVGFYLFPNIDLELRTSVGYVNAQAIQEDQTYNLHGIEARASFGYVPFDDSGPMLLYEMHSKQFERGPIRDYLTSSLEPKLPAVRRTSSVTAGWMFAF